MLTGIACKRTYTAQKGLRMDIALGASHCSEKSVEYFKGTAFILFKFHFYHRFSRFCSHFYLFYHKSDDININHRKPKATKQTCYQPTFIGGLFHP